MSHISKYLMGNMNNLETLKKALMSMGYTTSEGKLKGYQGSTAETDVIVKEKPSLGFKMTDGKIGFVGDFYNTGLNEKEFMKKLQSEYTYTELKKSAKSHGISIASVKKEGTKITVQCTY